MIFASPNASRGDVALLPARQCLLQFSAYTGALRRMRVVKTAPAERRGGAVKKRE